MRQVYKSGAIEAAPAAGAVSAGNPTEGNPIRGMPATVVGAYWFHMVSRELEAVIERAGLAPDEGRLTQLREAIEAILASGGGLLGVVDAKNGNYAAVSGDNGKTLEVDASGGARTVTLPNLGAGDDGFTVTVMKSDAGANAVTVDGYDAHTINGAANYTLQNAREAVILKWNGAAWLAIGQAAAAAQAGAGGITGPVDAKNRNYAAVSGDNGKTLEVDASGGARTVTLPNLGAGDDGFTVTVMKSDAGANAVTVDGYDAHTINGAANYTLQNAREAVILKWNGAAWLAIGGGTRALLDGFFGDASRREWAAAGNYNYTWEWGTPNGLAIIVGGSGGDGGGGGGGGGTDAGGTSVNTAFNGDAGTSGVSGVDSSVRVNGVTHTASGGPGGPGGSGGGGARSLVGSGRGINGFSPTSEDRTGGAGGAGGAGGGSVRRTGGGGQRGGGGHSGSVRFVVLESLSKGDAMSIVVGAGGARGTGGAGGRKGRPNSSDGGAGSGGPNAGATGRVIMVPLF